MQFWLHTGEVDAGDAVEFVAQVKLRRMAAGFSPPLGTQTPPLSRCRWGWRAIGGHVGRLVGEALHVLFERLIVFGDPLLVGVLQSPFLLEDK